LLECETGDPEAPKGADVAAAPVVRHLLFNYHIDFFS